MNTVLDECERGSESVQYFSTCMQIVVVGTPVT